MGTIFGPSLGMLLPTAVNHSAGARCAGQPSRLDDGVAPVPPYLDLTVPCAR